MNNIVAEIVELLKDGTDTIERETNLHRYIGKVICGFIAEALVLLDDGLWLEYKKTGSRQRTKGLPHTDHGLWRGRTAAALGSSARRQDRVSAR